VQAIFFVGHSVSFWFNNKYYQRAAGSLQHPYSLLVKFQEIYFIRNLFLCCFDAAEKLFSMTIVLVE